MIIFIDYGLSLGISYLYVIIVRNRKGSVESLLVIVIIYFFFSWFKFICFKIFVFYFNISNMGFISKIKWINLELYFFFR